eukprot:TRINITY_DN3517_c0_g1_i1.p1 TRINITY_DN3517_c0_g1~~TRINITY_DN3517_c0_g1_i1.p1  ORF type:complete len:367 (-),score=70.61 TRINITY_DN3517_c0_g1_i1:870-1970(-)
MEATGKLKFVFKPPSAMPGGESTTQTETNPTQPIPATVLTTIQSEQQVHSPLIVRFPSTLKRKTEEESVLQPAPKRLKSDEGRRSKLPEEDIKPTTPKATRARRDQEDELSPRPSTRRAKTDAQVDYEPSPRTSSRRASKAGEDYFEPPRTSTRRARVEDPDDYFEPAVSKPTTPRSRRAPREDPDEYYESPKPSTRKVKADEYGDAKASRTGSRGRGPAAKASKVDDEFMERTRQQKRRQSAPSEDFSESEVDSTVFKKLLAQLIKLDVHSFFRNPVTDDIAPGYSSVVSHPMCFEDMKAKCESTYKTISDVEHDFLLICTNCTTYNTPDTIFYKEAKKMQREVCSSFCGFIYGSATNCIRALKS